MEIKGNRTKTANPDRAHVLAWFWRLGLISEDAAHELSKHVSRQIMPSNTTQVMHLVDEAASQAEKDLGGAFKIEPWVNHFAMLESKLKELETKVELLARAQVKASEPKKTIAKPKA